MSKNGRVERLRHQIGRLREQVGRLGNSLQSIISANRTEWENCRLEAIEPYKQKALQALDCVDRHPFGGDQWLQKLETLEEELTAFSNQDYSSANSREPSEAIEESSQGFHADSPRKRNPASHVSLSENDNRRVIMTDNRHAGKKTEPKKRSQNLGQKQAGREETADEKLEHMGKKKTPSSDEQSQKQPKK